MTHTPEYGTISTEEANNFDIDHQIATMQAFKAGKRILCASRHNHPVRRDLFTPVHTPTWDWQFAFYKVDTTPVPMTVPSWASINPEYRWCAADENGSIYFYTSKPDQGDFAWELEPSKGYFTLGELVVVHRGDVDWKQTLIERPEGV